MGRNSSGTYTLPSPGVPFQSGQTISSAQVNNTLSDLATETTSSLDRSGRGGMLASLRGVDGTVAAPALAFTAEPATGFWRSAAGELAIALLGVLGLKFTSAGVQVSGANPILRSVDAHAALSLIGNQAAADTGTDTALGSTATRTAGDLTQVQNAGFLRLGVDFQGLLRLGAPAAAIQPASLVTAITPNTGLTAIGFAYWKDACGMVHLEGSVTNASGGSISGIATTSPLPTGFRADATMVAAASSGFFSVSVSAATGAISASTPGLPAGGQLFFDGLLFRATA